MWTHFNDMNSGGSSKEKQSCIFIEAAEQEAMVVFYNRFGHNPNRVSCTCCGPDYSIHEYETLTLATRGERDCSYETEGPYVPKYRGWVSRYRTLDVYLVSGEALVIYDVDIKPEERIGDVPEQGYVWKD